MIARLPKRTLAILASLLLVAGILTMTAPKATQAQGATGTVEVTKEIVGNPTTVPSGVEFTYLINYKYASTTDDGDNITLVDMLDPDLSWTGAEVVIGQTGHIASTSFNPLTGEVKWTFVDPLAAGASGQLTVKVRFPNGKTAPGTVADNTATMDGDNVDPATSNNVQIAAAASCGWITNITGPTNAMLDTDVTYVARLDQPSPVTGNLNIITPSTTSITLPVGVLPADVVNTNGGAISGTGISGDPVIVTWTITPSHNVGSNYTRNLVIRYDSARFTNGQAVSVSQLSSLTVVGNGTCGATDSQSTTLETFTPAPNGSVDKSASDTTVVPGIQEFYFTLDANNTGNVGLDNFIITDELPQNFALTSISLPSVNNGPGGNFINVVYRRSDTGNTEYTWTGSPFPAGVASLPVSALGLPAGVYVSYLRFDMGTVPVGFNINTTIRLYGTLLTTGWGSPSNTLDIGEQVCNTMTLSAVYNSSPVTPRTDTQCVTAIDPTVRPTVAKSIVSGSSIIPGGTTTWRVEVSNPSSSDIPMVNPVGMDLLPAELEYVPGSFTQNISGSYNSSGAPAPTLEVINNYNSTGRTLLRWTYSHSFPINTRSTVEFQTKVKPGTVPGLIPNYANVSVVPADQAGPVVYPSPVADTDDLNGNGSTTDSIGRSSAVNVTVGSAASLDSYKLVKGQLDSDYSKFPDKGQTSPGGTADYKLVVINTGNVPLKNVVVIDILPFVGDTAVTSTVARDSAFDLFLAGPVSAPSGVTVEYSTEKNPCRDEMGSPSPFPSGCAAANWSAVPPVDITTVHSIRFDFGSLVLGPLDEFELNWPMRAPVNAPFAGEVAWNSFGVVATRADNNSPLLPTEPIKVGVASQEPEPAAYGDKVWNDLNRDGIQDSGEPGINGVRVELYRDNGDGISDPDTDEYVGFTLTDANGEYLFTNLPAGDYYAVFFKPPTFAGSPNDQGSDDAKDSDGISSTVRGFPAYIAPVTTLDTLEDDRTWDQGFYQPETPVAAVGNYVWNDLNSDGIQNEPASAGLNGITVNLYDSNNVLVGTRVTADDVNGNPGYYLFDELTPGDYYLEFVKPSGFTLTTQNASGSNAANDSDPNTGTGQTATFTLAGGQYDPTWDAGMILPKGTLSLGDRVWNDADSDGIYEPGDGELGVNGVRLNLYQDTDGNGVYTPGVDQFFAMTTTFTQGGAPGYYEFKDLPAGDYIVQVDPSNFVSGGPLAGMESSPVQNSTPNDNVDHDNNGLPLAGHGVVSNAITLSAGSEPANNGNHNPTLDFGFVVPPPLGAIGDRIWRDDDGDGVQDPGEPGITGITVQLTPPADVDLGAGAGVPITQTTVADGKYLFEDLPEGEYTVTVINPPAGWPNTGDPDGGFDNKSVYDLGPGEINLDQDFGYQPKGALGDRIWRDDNGDGIQDPGEPGIPGITVQLTPPAGVDLGLGAGVPITQTTIADGKYLFDGLPEGNYTVTVVNPPVGWPNTGDPDGGFDNTSEYDLGLGERNLDQDFGYKPEGAIGDRIWRDDNGDGVQDPGEPGIPGITVQLTPPAGVDLGLGAGVPITQTTVADGKYLFDGLPEGNYTVTVVDPPAGWPNTGDPDGGFDNTSEYDLGLGERNLDQDFGYRPLGEIGDRIWVDSNGDGIQDPGEPGIPGITVTLTPPAGVDLGSGPGVPITQVTGVDGKYLFEDLPQGEYTVTVTPPTGMNQTGDPDLVKDNTSTVDLGPGESNLAQDFGYQPYIILTPSYLVTKVDEGKLTGHGSIACYWITLSAEPYGDVFIDVDPGKLLKEIKIDKKQIKLNSTNWNSLTLSNRSNFLCVRPVEDSIDESGPLVCPDKSADMTSDMLPHNNEECGDHKEFAEHQVNQSTQVSTGYGQSTPWENRTLTYLGRPANNYLEALILDNDKAEVLITESFAITHLDENSVPVAKACYWVTLGSQPINPVTITIIPDNTEVKTDKTSVTLDATNWNKIDPSFVYEGNKVCVRPIDESDIDPPDPQCWTGSNTMLGQPGSGVEKCGTHMGSVGHSVSSVDPKYATAPFRNTNGPDFDGDQSTIDVIVSNDDVAKLLFQPATVNMLSGTQTTLEVSLASRPVAEVVVSNETTELVFQPSNWNVPQEVEVVAPENQSGTPERLLFQYNVSSSDPHFGTLISDPVEVTVIPDRGVFLSSTAVSVSESGESSSYALALMSQPAANVEVTLSTDGQLTVEPATLTFTPFNWNQSQQVIVKAVDDNVAEAMAHQGRIVHTTTSSDPKYQEVTVTDIVVNIKDNDTAAVLASKTALTVSESGLQSATYDVVLQSQPTKNVVVQIDGGGQVTATPMMVVFTPNNWNTPQAVQVKAIDDDVDENGSHMTSLTHKSVSADPFYNGYEPNIGITVVDNDVAGVSLSQTTFSIAQGGTATYTMVLTSRPTSGVVIDLVANGDVAASNTNCLKANGDATCVYFTPDNWNVPQTVTIQVTGTGRIEHLVTSADGVYQALEVNPVLVNAVFQLFLPVSQWIGN